MKKQSRIIMSILFFILILSVSGCFNKDMDYEDGTYYEETDYDDRGWKSTLEVVVKNGNIDSVNYEEVNEKGEIKSEDEEYGETMKQTTGISPKEAYEKLEKSLLKTQNFEKVDTVSGATYSSENFIKLLKKSLKEKNLE